VIKLIKVITDYGFTIGYLLSHDDISVSFWHLKSKSNANENNSKIIVLHENPLTMEMLLDQLAGLNIIQLACNSPNSTCYNGMDYHYSKKDYYDSLDTISATFIGLVNVAISAVLKIEF
jgi:hypothetical protein